MEKAKGENLNFVHLSFFLPSTSLMHNLKTIRHMQILYIPNDCSAHGDLPFLVWSYVYDLCISYHMPYDYEEYMRCIKLSSESSC